MFEVNTNNAYAPLFVKNLRRRFVLFATEVHYTNGTKINLDLHSTRAMTNESLRVAHKTNRHAFPMRIRITSHLMWYTDFHLLDASPCVQDVMECALVLYGVTHFSTFANGSFWTGTL